MPQIYPVGLQLVERLYDKLVQAFPAVKDWLALTASLREESNYYRYGTILRELSALSILAGETATLSGINIPGLRAWMVFHITPPISFFETYSSVHWSAMVLTDSYAPDPTQYDPTTSVAIHLHNSAATPVSITDSGLWQYMGVVSRSLNGTDPDTGQQIEPSTYFAG